MNDVAKSLNLTPQQIELLNAVTTQTQNRLRTNFSQLGTLPEQERFNRTQQLHQEYSSAWMKGAGDILSQEQQYRYRQLQLQHGGFSSLANPEVQKQLNLTEEQRKNLRSNIDWTNQQLLGIQRLGETDRARAMQEYQQFRQEAQGRFNKFLTPQQQTWQQMTGQPFNFQPSFHR